jgi:hypothetical protein
MARIRTIKPEFWTSEQILDLSLPARLLFIGLWNFCDDNGVHPASARVLKARVFPADDITIAQVDGLIRELITQGLLMEYSAEDASWWYVTGWSRNQVINRPSASKYPKPPPSPMGEPPHSGAGQKEDHSPRGPARSPAGEATRGPARSPAVAPEISGQDTKKPPLTEDSLSAHGTLTRERKGRERIGKDRKVISNRTAIAEREGGAGGSDVRGARLSLSDLPEEWREWARKDRPDLDPDWVWAVFRDYWIAKPGAMGLKTDWRATWRNWVRREQASGAKQNAIRRESSAERFDRLNNTPIADLIGYDAASPVERTVTGEVVSGDAERVRTAVVIPISDARGHGGSQSRMVG